MLFDMRYFDLHCDTLYEMYERKEPYYKSSLHTDGERRSALQKQKQVYAIWSNPKRSDAENYLRFFDVLRYAKDMPHLITDRQSLDENGALLSVEGAGILACDEKRLDALYKSGVRLITLTWEGISCIGGAYDTDEGLTDFGKTVCEICAEKGITVDVSHLSDKGVGEVLDIAHTCLLSVTASHSCLRALCDERRNLSDTHARKLARLGGCVGINLVGTHLTKDYFSRGASIEDVVRHVKHAVNIMGRECVCIGADFDGTEKLPKEIRGIEDMGRLYGALPESLADDVFYNNAYNFFKRSLK